MVEEEQMALAKSRLVHPVVEGLPALPGELLHLFLRVDPDGSREGLRPKA